MNKYLVVGAVVLGFLCSALTPRERDLAQNALTELRTGRLNTQEAATKIQEAQVERDQAKGYASSVANDLGTLRAQVEAAAKREEILVTRVNEMQAEHDRVHSYWGIGAITLGISILAKHLFIAAIVIVVLALALWAISMTPWGAFVGVFLRAASDFIRMIGAIIGNIFRRIKERFQKK